MLIGLIGGFADLAGAQPAPRDPESIPDPIPEAPTGQPANDRTSPPADEPQSSLDSTPSSSTLGPPSVRTPVPARASESRYPLAATARPLVLPRGGLEVSVPLRFQLTKPGSIATTSPHARYSAGRIEIEAGLSVYLFDTGDWGNVIYGDVEQARSDLVPSLFAAARYAISPDLAVGLEIAAEPPQDNLYSFPTMEEAKYSPRAEIAYKARPLRAVSAEASLAAGIDHWRTRSSSRTAANDYLATRALVRLQTQLSPRLALEGHAQLGIGKRVDTEIVFSPPEPSWFQTLDYGVRLAVAINPSLDVTAALDFVDEPPEGTPFPDELVFISIGLTARRLP